MTIVPEVEMVTEEELESLLEERLGTPCDCDHEKCGRGCKGHHLELSIVDPATGHADFSGFGPTRKPCSKTAAWLVSIRGEVQTGFIPPSPRYLCDTCKNFWSKAFFGLIVEKL